MDKSTHSLKKFNAEIIMLEWMDYWFKLNKNNVIVEK